MPLAPLFHGFRPLIDSRFVAARADGGEGAASVVLRIEETPLGKGNSRAEFMVVDPAGPVRITWNGIASLWAFSQGAARLARRMFEGKRNNQPCLQVEDDPELERGLNCFELARRFCTQDIPVSWATPQNWPKWAPQIDPSPKAGSDDEVGIRFFTGALDWILRHEIAHVALRHANRQQNESLSNQECESEADLAATKWLKGERSAALNRLIGEKPAKEELQLEWLAISNGLGLIWVALFEDNRPQAQASGDHPPVATRLFACLDALGLREDSSAAEILADIVQAWIGPEENWAPEGGHPTALDAISEALLRLHRHRTT